MLISQVHNDISSIKDAFNCARAYFWYERESEYPNRNLSDYCSILLFVLLQLSIADQAFQE